MLVCGAGGMLGHRLAAELVAHGHEVIGTTRRGGPPECWPEAPNLPKPSSWESFEAPGRDRVRELVALIRPAAVVNAIGIVKQRHEPPRTEIEVNALFPHLLAEASAAVGARLVHLSTDCVFSGRGGGYTESDVPDPLDLYGRSKLLGETIEGNAITLRTSMVGWELGTQQGLLEWLSSQRGKSVRGFRKAVFSGLATPVLSRLIAGLLEGHRGLGGVWHAASLPISKYELLRRMRDMAGWRDIELVPDDEVVCDRSLDGTAFSERTGWQAPTWDEMLGELCRERRAYAGEEVIS